MDTVDLEEMGLIDGSGTFISDITDTQPILCATDGTISINSEYLSASGGRIAFVTIPNLVQVVQDANSPDIGFFINNNQIRINRPIVLNGDCLTDTAENSADENSKELLNNSISDCWNALNEPPQTPKNSIIELPKRQKAHIKESNVASSSKSSKNSTLHEDVEPPDRTGPFFCEQCGLEFLSWKLFKRHKTKHLLEKPFKCDICRESFNYENNLILHMATHNADNPFCPMCKKKFSRIAGLKAHMLLHEQEESLFCSECGEEFSSRVYLEEHMGEHKEHKVTSSEPLTRKLFKCNCCNAKFETFLKRKEHFKEFHKSAKTRRLKKYAYSGSSSRRRGNNICEYCTKCFDKPSQLLRHKRIHTGERPFKCELCSRAFNQKGSLQIHMLKHTRERPYVCQYCQGTFSQKGNLQAHIKRLHFSSDSDERIFKCKLCSCIFRNLGSLNAHFTKAHALGQTVSFSRLGSKAKTITTNECSSKTMVDSSPDSSNKENEVDKADDAQKVFVTITNGQEDKSIQDITGHPRKVKNKLHSCGHCQKEFGKASDMIRHMRVHTQEKSFKCNICSKSFAWNSNLVDHLKTHKVKTHFCCGKTFNSIGSLKFHESIHQKKGESSVGSKTDCKPQKKIVTASLIEEALKLEEIVEPPFVVLDQLAVSSLSGNVLLTENGSIVDISSEVEDEEENETTKSSLKCSECNLVFKKVFHLKAHRRKHHGDMPYKCKLCPCSFTTAKSLKKHVDIHLSSGKYICEHCGKQFPCEIALKSHSDAHLPGFPWACPVCGAGFKSFAACRRHITVHPKIGPMKYKPMAVECNQESKSEEVVKVPETEVKNTEVDILPLEVNENKISNSLPNDLRDFINSLQPGQEFTITGTFPAGEDTGGVSYSSITEEQLSSQYTIIEEKNFFNSPISPSQKQLYDESLENCIFLQSYFSKQNLEMEGADISTLLPQVQSLEKCDECNLLFTNEADFTIHKAIHAQKQPHTCLTCDQSFMSAIEYEDHMKYHLNKESAPVKAVSDPNPETISSDLSILPQASLLRNASEKKKIRTPWRPPARRLTDEETKVLASIDSNTASVSEKVLLQSLIEKEKYEHPVKEEPKAQERHQNKCKYCPKSFKKPSDLTRHLRTHTGERPFQCTSCPKRFSIKSTASSHMKTHTKDRSFSCFICSKNFATPGSLKIHMRLHTGIKPFSCHLCDAKFRTSGHKKAHLKKHLKEIQNESNEVVPNNNKSNDEGHFLEIILNEAEYLSSIESDTNNEANPLKNRVGSQYLVPLNDQTILTDKVKKSVSEYLINIDGSANANVDSPRYLLSVKDSSIGEDGFIVEKLSNDQIIVTITDPNSAILPQTNQSSPSTPIINQVSTEKSDLELHYTLASHHLQRDLTCSDCAESFSLEEDLQAHKCTKAHSLDLALDHDLFLFPPV